MGWDPVAPTLKTKSYLRVSQLAFLLDNYGGTTIRKKPSTIFTIPSLTFRLVTVVSNARKEPPQLVLEHDHKYQIACTPFVYQIVFFQLKTYKGNNQLLFEVYFPQVIINLL